MDGERWSPSLCFWLVTRVFVSCVFVRDDTDDDDGIGMNVMAMMTVMSLMIWIVRQVC